MKNPGKFAVFGIVVCCFLLISAVNGNAKVVLKMNHQFPATITGSILDQEFADTVLKETGGEVEIKIFWKNALGKPKENLRMLKQGHIEMAAMSAGYFPKELPFHSAPNSIPMGMDDICQSDAMMEAFVSDIQEFKNEASKNSIRPVFFHLLNPYLLVSKKPVTKFSDIKGMRIRTWGEDMPKLVKAAGAKPVKLFLPDIYKALENNVIDACPFSVDLMVSYKIFEHAKNVTEVVMWEGPSWGIWINDRAWKKLTPAQQEIIMKAAKSTRSRELSSLMESEVKSRALLKEKGVVFNEFPPEELEKWQKANPDFFADWIEKMKGMGKESAAKQTVEKWKEMRNSISCPEK